MSAPVTERGRSAVRGRSAAIPAQRGIADGVATADPGAVPAVERAGKPTVAEALRRSAQQKAYARRDDRVRRAGGARPARTAAPAGRPQFVLLIMVLLAVGLVATLWLSTAAAADSYRLQDATAEARVLSEQAERLHQEVAVLESAPELARRAAGLGMTPVRDPARLVVTPDGSVEVVGEPRAAVAPPPPAPPGGAQPPAADGTDTEGTPPEGPDQAENGADGDDAGRDDAGRDDTGQDRTGENDVGENDAGEDGTAQLALPGEDAGQPAVDGEAPAASAEGARADAQGQDESGRDGAGGGTEPGTAEAAGRSGDGTDAG